MATGRRSGLEFPKHFDGKRFYNPDAPQAPSLFAALRWKLTSRPEPSPRFISDVVESKPPDRVEGTALRVTLVNHSTVLLQHRGLNILTDPIWSERTSPISWAGPRRRRKPGVSLENLPRLAAVLLSHNHYDHLDLPSLHRLSSRGSFPLVVPLGVAHFLRSKGIEPVHELDWGGSWLLESCSVHCVPAYHFSSRSLFDRNRTLWCGYVLEFPERSIYFAADTAFGPHFAQIRDQFGPPDLALLPIGAYKPEWFMSPVHMSLDDAVRAHTILGAKQSIAIHHGTFQLGDDAVDTPRMRLAECVIDGSFLALNNGEFAEIP